MIVSGKRLGQPRRRARPVVDELEQEEEQEEEERQPLAAVLEEHDAALKQRVGALQHELAALRQAQLEKALADERRRLAVETRVRLAAEEKDLSAWLSAQLEALDAERAGKLAVLEGATAELDEAIRVLEAKRRLLLTKTVVVEGLFDERAVELKAEREQRLQQAREREAARARTRIREFIALKQQQQQQQE